MKRPSVLRELSVQNTTFTTARAMNLLARALLLVAVCSMTPAARATANYVYHERTANNPGCGTDPFVTTLAPTWLQAHPLKFKVEYQSFVNTAAAVYYTTDGSAPIGSFGNASNTTVVVAAALDCTFQEGTNIVDVWSANIPAQAAGTAVRYIIGAWHSDGGPEIFANSGENSNPFDTSGEATVFEYVVGSATLYWDADGVAPVGGGAGTWNLTGANWSTDSSGTSYQIWNNANVDSAIFGGTAGAITFGADLTVNRITTMRAGFGLGANGSTTPVITFSGGGAGVHAQHTNGTTTLGGNYTGSLLIKSGPGRLELNNANNTMQKYRAVGGFLSIPAISRLGTAPASLVSDYFTLDGAGFTTSTAVATNLGATRGVTIGAGGAFFGAPMVNNPITIDAPIVGSSGGAFTVTTGAPFYNPHNAGGIWTISNTGNSWDGPTKVAGGVLRLGAAGVIPDTSPLTVSAGGLDLATFSEMVGPLTITGGTISDGTLIASDHQLQAGTISAVLAGSGGLVKSGTGTLALTAANSYTGDTLVSAGTLRVANLTGSATSAGLVTVEPGATLTGPGSIAGTLTVNGTISPGTSPGTQNTGSEVWNGGASYLWEIDDVDAGPGTDPGWDLINITGGLTINATTESKFNINITSLTPGNLAGDVHDFNNTTDYSWTILKTTTGISGFDPAVFNLNPAGFSNPVGPGGLFLIETANGGNDLILRFVNGATVAVQPVGGNAECGGMFMFSVTANGSAPLSYQWKHEGTNLPGATASTLTVIASADTAGTYAVEIANPLGTTTSDTVTLTVADTTPPMIACAPDATVECGAAWDFTAPTAIDSCDANPTVSVVSTVTNNVAGGFAATRTWQATDASLNSAQCSQTITVLDPIAPQITCPANITACTSSNSAVVTFAPTVLDACDPAPTIVCSPASGSDFPLGPTLVTCEAYNAFGKTNTCSFSVTVNQNTTVTGLANVTVCPGTSVTFGPVTTGGGCARVTPTLSQTLFVDAILGNDSTAVKGRMDRPWKTITNVFAAVGNGETIRIGLGNYTNTLFYTNLVLPGFDFPAVRLHNKTNVLIEGSGPGTKLWGLGLGTHIQIQNCNNITLRDFQILGNKPAESLGATITNYGFAALHIKGNGENYTFERLTFKDHANQVLSTINPGVGVGTTKYVKVRHCWFENWGATNGIPVLGQDGPAVSPFGDNWEITDNVFTNGLRCIEPYSEDVPIRNCVISRNRMQWVEWQGICPIYGFPFQRAIITDNIIEAQPHLPTFPGQSGGIVGPNADMAHCIIANNIISGFTNGLGISLQGNTSAAILRNNQITGNSISNCYVGITLNCANGIHNTNVNGNVVSGNAIVKSGNDAITFAGVDNIISGNYIEDFGFASTVGVGIHSRGDTAGTNWNNRIENNTLINGVNGIWIREAHCKTNIVRGNYIRDVTTPFTDEGTGTITNWDGAVPTVTVCPGTSVTFGPVTTGGTGPFAFQWTKDGVVIDGATSDSYIVTSATAGAYCVIATGACNSATNCALLTVHTPPAVAVNSPPICAGETATLTATTDATNPTYSWSPGGATTPSIMVAPSATTTYTVTVTDGVTMCSSSATGTVTVVDPAVFANSSTITLNDNAAASPYPSTIDVSGLTALICKVTVSVSGLSHTWPDDIDLLLVGPAGQTVLLMSDAGGDSAVSDLGLTFDDAAAGSLADETAIASGTYRPSNFDPTKDNLPGPAPGRPYGAALSVFDGSNPNGAWSLYVLDDEVADVGQIGGWSLAITGTELSADLAVAKADAPDPVAVGSNLTYSVVITNQGPAAAENVSLTDTLPANVSFVSASASQGSCSGSQVIVTCDLGAIAAGQAATFTLVVSPQATGPHTNSVTVASTTTDIILANNSASAETTVLAPPVVTVQSANVTICSGGTAMFAITATGEPPPSYQWRKDGIDLAGETNPTLTLNNALAGDAGAYDVRVSNAVGSTFSDPASLTVLPPTSATLLANVPNICPGSTATFSTTASGTGPFSFLWRKDGVEVTGETANSLSVTVTESSVGTYCVEVTGLCGSVTNCATLTIVQPPAIATQPQHFNGVQGDSATFSVVASGTAPLTYEWRYNGAPLSNGGQVAGATSNILTISSLNCTNEGQFDVIVTNCSGSVTSTVAVLAVRPITAVYFDFETIGQYTNNLPNNGGSDPLVPIPFEVASGGAQRAALAAGGRALDLLNNNGTLNDSAFPAMPYDFSVNGRVLRASVMFKLKAGANNVNDTVMMLGFASKASRLDSGDEQLAFAGVKILGQGATASAPATGYQMQLRNKVFSGTGIGTSNATANAALVNGNWYKLSVNFTNIKATVNNAFRYNATLQDMGANGATPGANVLATNSATVINADLVNDSSVFFDFRVRENAGNDLIDNLSIHTADGPVFFACQPRSQTVLQGRPATINAYIDGTPPFAYQWLKGGAPILGATDWQYKIPAVSAADAGDYSLQVTADGAPIVSAAATLTVTPDATGPVLVSAGSFDGCSIGVCFDEPLDSVSATTEANYSVSGASVGFAQLRPDRKSVILYISPAIDGAFTVTVNGVQDVFGNTITAGSSAGGNVASHLTSLEIGGPLPSVAGNDAIYSCKDGDFDIAAGGADVWGNSDQFRFTHQPRTGDFDVRVKIAAQSIPNTILKAGLLVRENLDPASRTLHAIVNPPWPALDRYETGQRTVYSGTTASWGVAGLNQGNRAATAPNSWIRMRRVNNTFTAYAASNGVDWAPIGQTTQFYPPTVLVGLEMVSHIQGRLGMTEFRSFGDFDGYPDAVINITTHPASTNINAGQNASFTVAATVTAAPASELQYQWQRSDGMGGFTNIPNASAASASFATPALFGADSGAQFRCVVRVAGVAGAASDPAVVTVTDDVAPTLVSANVLAGSLRNIVLVFSEPVTDGAADGSNYDVATDGGLPFTVASAAFFGNASTIVLTVTADLFPDLYRVIVNNVQDLSAPPNTIALNTTRPFRQYAAPIQPVVIEMFQDIGNNGTVANLQGQSIYAQGFPTHISYSNIFGFNVSLVGGPLPGTSGTAQEQYGVRAYTHFIPPTNGNYKFWIRSDDGMQLWMNTNAPLGQNGARSAVFASSTNHPAAEVAPNAIDNLPNTKYLNFDEFNTGFTVTPAAGSSIVTGMRFTTANDAADRDPMTFLLEGTTADPRLGPWTVIVPETSTQLTNTLARLTAGPAVSFANTDAYTSYRVIFPTVRTNATANSMQIAEVEFLDASGRDVTDSGIVLIAENAAASGNYSVGSTPANSKTNIALIGGQRYFLEALLREGTGGDGFSVTWTDPSVTTPPANTTFITSSALAYPEGSAPPTPVIAELYTGPVPGTTFGGGGLADLATVTNHMKWGNAPDVLVYQKYFGFQPGTANTRFDNYAGRIYSFFTAPSNGLYKIWVRHDDAAQIFMNTNSVNSTNPAGAVLLYSSAFISGTPYTNSATSQNIPLTGGQSYYIEARWKEGGGGDGIAVTFRAQSDMTVPPGGPIVEVASAQFLALPHPPVLRVGAIGLAAINPSSPVLSEGQTVTLSPDGLTGALPYTFRWLKNGAFVADTFRYTTLPATVADHGAVYTLIVSNAFSRAQASATLTVNIDTTAPAIASVSSHSYLTNLIITFSEPIKHASAVNPSNYQIPGLTVLGGFADSHRVSLFTSPQTPGAPYVLSVNGLSDNSQANNPLAPASVPFNAWEAAGCEVGSLQVELFTNITGTAIANLASDGRYINNLADSFSAIRQFQWTSVPPLTGNGMDNYAVRISGHFIPPSNGVYRFYVRSDDASQLFLNSNPVNSTDPAGKALIAREDTCCKAYGDTSAGGPRVSIGIPLNAGQPYYIEGLLKEGGGGDFFQMAWREEGDPSTPPNNENASGQFFALPPNPLDTLPPQVVRTYSLSGRGLVIEFNEPLDALDLSNPNLDPFNFYINDGATTVNPSVVSVRADGRSLLLDTPQLGASTYSIQIDSARDQRCNIMPPVTVPGVVFALAQGLRDNIDIGAHNTVPALTGGTAPMVNPASPGSAPDVSPGNLTIIAGGTDIWDNADGMHYAYGFQTGDFDVRVRVESLVPRNRWSKAGLMVRENFTGGSRNVHAIVDPAPVPALDSSGNGQNVYEANKRDVQDGGPSSWSSSSPTPVPYPNAWVRLRRAGDTFLAYASSDGVNWVQYGSTTATYPLTVLLGLATTAHNNNFGLTTTAIYHDYGFILPPSIADPPDNLTVISGETANFSVGGVTGTAPFFYQWRFNGGNILDATNSSLTLNNVTVANAGNYDVAVSNMNSSVTSDIAVLTVQELDFGDAPAPYPTLLINNGARHIIVAGFHLGAATTDGELNGQPSTLADGDDATGTDDEDGVVGATPLIRSQTASVDVLASAAGKLDAWIDYNRDGDWADPGEQVANNAPLAAGVNTLPLPIPAAASDDGPTYARLRFSSIGGLAVDGMATDGEVEDYVVVIENTAPVARNDGFGTVVSAPLSVPASALLANDSDPNSDTLSVTSVGSPTLQGGTVTLMDTTVTYTPPTGFSGGDFFTYTINDGHGGTATATVCITVNIANLAYSEPFGGWAYIYNGAGDSYGTGGAIIGNSALDGFWTHGNGSDSWADEPTLTPDRPGVGNGLVGGIGSVTEADPSVPGGMVTFLRMVDGITAGSTTTDNRRFYFMRDLSTLPGFTPTFMDSGITITFRARLVPDDALEGALTPANKGGMVGDDGRGMFGFCQASGDQIVAFSLHTATEDGGPTPMFSGAGLTLNKNVGTLPSNAVGNPSSAAFPQNDLPLDPNLWHEFWITVQANNLTNLTPNGTHTATIYMDGNVTPAGTFNFTAGNGDEGTSTSPVISNYLQLGQNFTPLTGAFDTDFYAVRMGTRVPSGFNDPVTLVSQPASITVVEGAPATFGFFFTGTPPFFFQWFENGSAIPNATNSTYARVTACADNGRVFRVVVSNFCSQATSAPVTLTVTPAVPALRITRQGSDVVIAWNMTCEPFIVQEATSLQPDNTWVPAIGTASTEGNEQRLRIPINFLENCFYRLRQQN